ncbi:MAG: C4-type zinc ribbon domain-containing protein [Deltaproteobacteria bacterium]|nr:C4-type zinc ribbon domain-containing protein [Deltaproteobacteria bacterium]
MNQQVSFIIEIQNIDMDLLKFEEAVKEILKDIKETEDALKLEEERRGKLRNELLELNKKVDMEELNIKSYDERIAKMKDAQKLIQTNKEYNAMQKSVKDNESLKKKSEDDILSYLTNKDELNNEILHAQKAVNELTGSLAEKSEIYKKSKQELDKVKKDSNDKKALLVGKVKKEYYAVYEAVKRNKKLPAVASVAQSGACTGCYRMLPPQQFNELLSETLFMQCPVCSRILYVEQNNGAGSAGPAES